MIAIIADYYNYIIICNAIVNKLKGIPHFAFIIFPGY